MVKRTLFAIVMMALAQSWNSAVAGDFLRLSHTACAEPQCGDACADPCGEVCANACGESCDLGLGSLLGDGCGSGITSLLHKSDHCFDEFISPITNPIFFEDPRTLTEARLIYVNHSLPAALGGHNVQVLAMQVRAALNEDLSIIATKDGFIMSDSPLVRDGWADIAAGLKLNIYKDYQSQTIISAGTTFEMPTGTPRALQGNGDGEFHLFLTGATEIVEDYHWISGSGFRLPCDGNAESSVWYWSNHIDRKIGDTGLYLLGECNWYHWMGSGTAFPLPVEGVDLINLGSVGVAGNDIVTSALGVKYKPSANMEIGFAWEVPLTDRRDILDDRYTVDWIFRY